MSANSDTTSAIQGSLAETGSSSSAQTGYTNIDSYLAWLDDPGEPGVNYDPHRFTISYVPQAKLPAGIDALAPPAGERAADRPGSMLREDKSYEPLTDAIAARYGLAIDKQVYWGRVRVASFLLAEGADGDRLLADIRREFAGCVQFAGYSMLLHSDGVYIPDDPDYKKSMANEYSELWSLHKIGASQAWGFTRGKPSVIIAVLDTGIRITHEELTAQVINPDDLDFSEVPGDIPHYVDLANDDNTMEDLDGHGTFIAGQIAAEGDNQRTIVGLAHKCKILPIKITDGGTALDINIAYGSVLAYNLGARVISLSFGDYHTSSLLEDIVNELWIKGAIFVASAGNDNVSTPHYPSDYANSISVGATDKDDAKADFSNYSEFVDIAAPGLGIKSCGHLNDTDYPNWTTSAGTSFASPLVAAAAGLLWSYDPSLKNQEIRSLLEGTAKPTTGFTEGTVGRLDIGAALGEVTPIKLDPPQLTKLVHSGEVSLTVEITGSPDRVDCYFNGHEVGSRTSAPWTYTVDTTTLSYGLGSVLFVGALGELEASAQMDLLVDNTQGTFPVTESFEKSARDFYPLELKTYSLTLLEAIKSLPDSDWTENDIRNSGAATWNDVSGSAWDGYASERFGAGEGYSGFEIDALVSRRLDLSTDDHPSLVFYHHYNIEDGGSQFDRARVLVSADGGQTFTSAKRHGGGNALYSGYLAGWQREEIDLSPFAGGKIHLALVFESNDLQDGEEAGEDAGWWVDKLTVAMDYVDDIPSIGTVTVAPYSAFGSIPGIMQINAGVQDPDNVASVEFTLDLAPLGSKDDYDVQASDNMPPFQSVLDIPAGMSNQLANLLVNYYDIDGVPGPVVTVPVYLFNQRGDTNGDGRVNVDDLAGFAEMTGLTPADEGYIPLFDSDYDGIITELDAAAVGYYYGTGS